MGGLGISGVVVVGENTARAVVANDGVNNDDLTPSPSPKERGDDQCDAGWEKSRRGDFKRKNFDADKS